MEREPLHELTSAIKDHEQRFHLNCEISYLTLVIINIPGRYGDKAPTPVLGAQLFRIKELIRHKRSHLEITAYHISDDVMQRSYHASECD